MPLSDKPSDKPSDKLAEKPKPQPSNVPAGQEATAKQAELNKAATPDRADAHPGIATVDAQRAAQAEEVQPAGHDYNLDPMPQAVVNAIKQAAKTARIVSSKELADRKFEVVAHTSSGKTCYVVGRDGNIFSTEPIK